jgi:hypothetical protein
MSPGKVYRQLFLRGRQQELCHQAPVLVQNESDAQANGAMQTALQNEMPTMQCVL